MKSNLVATATAAALLLVLTTLAAASDSKKEFAGSEKCKGCHAEEYKSWKGTYHAKLLQPRKGGILKEAVEKWATDGANQGPT